MTPSKLAISFKSLNLEKTTSVIVEVLAVALIIFIGHVVLLSNSYGLDDMQGSDLHWEFFWATDVSLGTNPYLSFDTKQLLAQEKVPGLLPFYFLVLAYVAKFGDFSFVLFLDFWRYIVFFAYSGVGVLIYLFVRPKSKLLAIFFVMYFMLNRLIISSVAGMKQDLLAIFFVMLALSLIKKNKLLAFLFFGIATGIKHLTVFIAPIFLLEFIEIYSGGVTLEKIKRGVIVLLISTAPIVIPAIPFLVQSPEHFTGSILFNLTREPEAGIQRHTGFDRLLVLYNNEVNNNTFFYMLPRLPFLVVYLMCFYLLVIKRLSYFTFASLAYLVFVTFNPVMFGQYQTWFLAFLPLGLSHLSADWECTQ